MPSPAAAHRRHASLSRALPTLAALVLLVPASARAADARIDHAADATFIHRVQLGTLGGFGGAVVNMGIGTEVKLPWRIRLAGEAEGTLIPRPGAWIAQALAGVSVWRRDGHIPTRHIVRDEPGFAGQDRFWLASGAAPRHREVVVEAGPLWLGWMANPVTAMAAGVRWHSHTDVDHGGRRMRSLERISLHALAFPDSLDVAWLLRASGFTLAYSGWGLEGRVARFPGGHYLLGGAVVWLLP